MNNEHLISLYIDDEMDMAEKITFVETVYQNQPFTDTALALLRQEQQLRADLTIPAFQPDPRLVPAAARSSSFPRPVTALFNWYKPLAAAAVAASLLVGLFFAFQPQIPLAPVDQGSFAPQQTASVPTPPLEHQQRFVLYLPGSRQARIIGTFTNWKPLPMERIGSSGYWSLTLPVPPGEHRYSYLIEENKRIADPTVVAREQDDFGGENSIIEVQTEI